MKRRIQSESELYQTYNDLSKSEYTFLLGRIKNFSMLQYLYGKECISILQKDIEEVFQQVLPPQEYIYLLQNNHYVLFLKTQDPYRIIQFIYQIDHIIETHEFKMIKHTVSFAYGIYFMQHQLDFYEAYDHAKFAMLTSKDIMKHNTTFEFFDLKQDERAKQQFQLQSELESALDKHEFEIYLQVKVDAKTHKARGCEALTRWVHQGSEIPLQDFMPMIDKNAFIRHIDLFVFEEVCKLLSKWKEKGMHLLPISVNISRASFEDGFYYLKEIKTIFQRFSIDKSFIEFELSEEICFENNHRLHRFLDLLIENGFQCSLDDFGSGYSSLYSLTYLPVKTVKLDSSFCLGTWNKKLEVLLDYLLHLLHELSFEIVVEGIESKEVADFFLTHPCELLQGFYFSKPLPIDQFEERYLHIEQ